MAADDEIARLQAQLDQLKAVGKLEDQLLAAKTDGASDTRLRTIKDKLRDARREYRLSREADRPATADGAVVANPDSVRVTASVKE